MWVFLLPTDSYNSLTDNIKTNHKNIIQKNSAIDKQQLNYS